MKKKYLYSLLTTYLLAAGALSSCTRPQPEIKRPKRVKKIYVYKKPELKVRIDTINVTDETIKQLTTNGAGGIFCPGTNTVIVYHFKPLSESLRVQKYCKINNNMQPLFTRHELEHARKQDIVHNTDRFSPFGRAEVAAINEIMAPASEIIEAVDYHAHTGKPFADVKSFITQADSAITSIVGPFGLPGYVNYNYQPVADAVITYALENFKTSVARGYYVHTIKQAYNRTPSKKPKFIDANLFFTFDPDMHRWDPIWEFESRAGKCNPYRNASFAVRQKLMQTVDSIVCSATGADKIEIFYRNAFLR